MENLQPQKRKTYFNGLLESWEVELEDGTPAVEYIMQTGETPSPVTPFAEGQEYRISSGELWVKINPTDDWQWFRAGDVCVVPPNTPNVWLKVQSGTAKYIRVKLKT